MLTDYVNMEQMKNAIIYQFSNHHYFTFGFVYQQYTSVSNNMRWFACHVGAAIVAPTWLAAAVRESTLLFVTERDLSLKSNIKFRAFLLEAFTRSDHLTLQHCGFVFT